MMFWIVFVAMYFLIMPLMILSQTRSAAAPQFEWLQLDRLAPDVAQFLLTATNELAQEGFASVAYLLVPGITTHATPILALLINRQTGDKALVSVIYTFANGQTKIATKYVEFTTRFEDDSSVGTLNTRSLPAYYKPPYRRSFRFPDVQDLHHLYALHQALRQKFTPNLKPVLPPEGHEVAWLAASMHEEQALQVQAGRMRLDAAAGAYRPTLKGAYLMAWGLMWPIKPFRQWQLQQRSRALQRELALHAG